MAMGLVKRLSRVALIMLIVLPALAEGQALYADRSGSMDPYYNTGLVFQLCESISAVVRSQSRSSPQVLAFSTDSLPVKSIDALGGVPLGANTYLDRALEDALGRKFKIVWMITDNLQDESDSDAGVNTAAFYERLKKPAVRRVAIFPIVRAEGMTGIPDGQPGIVIYGLLLDAGADSEFEREIRELTAHLKGQYSTECFIMKPLNEKTIDSSIVNSTFRNDKQKPYLEGDAISGTMEIRFKSNFRHLKIAEATVEPDMKYGFGPETLFTFAQPNVNIDPEKVNNLGPGEDTDQAYLVSVDIGRVRLKRDPISIWKAAFGQLREDGRMNFSFLVKVHRDKLVFRDDFLNAYNARDTETAKQTGKVYAIDQLPSLLAEEVTSIRVESPQPFRVKYPWWPAPLIFGGGLLTLALVGLAIWQAAKAAKGMISNRTRWEVEVAQPQPGKGAVEGNRVKVRVGKRVIRVGTIKDGSLNPASIVRPQNRQAIVDGHPINLTYNDNPLVLIFRRSQPRQETPERRTTSHVKIKT